MDELDELVGQFGDDAQTMRDILARNAPARTVLAGRENVYKTLMTGTPAEIDAIVPGQTRGTTVAATTTTPGFDLTQLDAEIDKRFATRFTSAFETPEFTSAVEKRAAAIAAKAVKDAREGILGDAARTSDSIYQVRRAHEKEFGKELDTAAFTAWMDEPNNKGKFADLSKAHDAFVQEERISKRIEEGVTAKLAAQQTNQVPGTSLPTSQSPLGAMIRHNTPKDAEVRGAGLDAAANAFRTLQSSHATQ